MPGLLNFCAKRTTEPAVSYRITACSAPLLALAMMLANAAHQRAEAQPQGVARPTVNSGASWAALSPAQRLALQPLERHWNTIEVSRQQKWLEIAARFDRMSPDERTRVQQRMSDWVGLSAKQRNEARQNFQGAQELSAGERQARWQTYKELPEDQRRGLAARAKSGSATAPRPSPPSGTAKVNTVPNPLIESRRTPGSTPSVVQARPGATTNLISTKPAPPLHQQTGLPKVAATPEFVDSTTLLPQRGPQGAATDPRRRP